MGQQIAVLPLCIKYFVMLQHKYLLIFLFTFDIFTVAAQPQQSPVYIADKIISLPGEGGYDYLAIDHLNKRLYVSHGSAMEVIDLLTEKPAGKIEGMQGIHGVAIVNEVNKGFISDGKTNSVVVFDLTSLKKISSIALSGKKPDAIIYDPFSKHVFAFNGSSDNVSVIDINTLKELQT